jgi:Berberine and berberine like
MIDRRPAFIARYLAVADVVTGVNFAREHGLTLSIKGGGHRNNYERLVEVNRKWDPGNLFRINKNIPARGS